MVLAAWCAVLVVVVVVAFIIRMMFSIRYLEM